MTRRKLPRTRERRLQEFEHRLAHCGLTPRSILPDGTNSSLKCSVEGEAYESNLQTCGSPHICTTCGFKIRSNNARLMRQAFEAWFAEDGFVYLVTLTASSESHERLEALLDRNQAAYSLVNAGRAKTRFFEEQHIAGVIKNLDITIGRNGWHPHYHLAVFVRNEGQDPEQVEAALQAFYGERWTDAISKQGATVSASHGVDVRQVTADNGLSTYLAKPDFTATSHALVGERSPGLNIWGIIDAMAENDNGRWDPAFYEYADATFARNSIDWGRGRWNLKKLLLSDDPTSKLSDEEVAELDPSEDLPKVDLGKNLTRLFAMDEGVACLLLQELEDHGAEGVIKAMDRLGHNYSVTWRTREVARRFDTPIEVHLPLIEIARSEHRARPGRACRGILQAA